MEDAESTYERAIKLIKCDRLERGIKLLDRAIELCPENVDFILKRCSASLVREDHKRALEDAKRASLLDPDNGQALHLLAKCHVVYGNYALAKEALEKSNRKDEDLVDVIVSSTSDLKNCKSCLAHGNYLEARDYCSQILTWSPECVEAKLLKVSALIHLKQVDDARNEIEKVLESEPNNSEALLMKARLLTLKLEFKDAIIISQKVLTETKTGIIAEQAASLLNRIERNYKTPLVEAGDINVIIKKNEEAIKAVEDTACRSDIHLKLSDLYIQCAEPFKALDHAQLAILTNGDNMAARLRCVELLQELGLVEEALKFSQELYERQPTVTNADLIHRIQDFLEQFEAKGHYFTLSIPTSSTKRDIEEAYDAILAKFSGGHLETVSRLSMKRRSTVHRAYQVLSDRKQRFEYDLTLGIENGEKVYASHDSVHCSQSVLEVAELKNQEGLSFFEEQDYKVAILCYEKAIKLCPKASYYFNRSQAFVKVRDYISAQRDLRMAIKCDWSYLEAYRSLAGLYLLHGNVEAAANVLSNAGPLKGQLRDELEPKLTQLATDIQLAASYLERKEYNKALKKSNDILQECTECVEMKLLKAEALARLNCPKMASDVLDQLNFTNYRAHDKLFVRALIAYYRKDYHVAVGILMELSPLSPRFHDELKRVRLFLDRGRLGKICYEKGEYEHAIDHFTEILDMDSNHSSAMSTAFYNRAKSRLHLGLITDAYDDCCEAIRCNPENSSAYMIRCQIYHASGLHEEAMRDYDKAIADTGMYRELKLEKTISASGALINPEYSSQDLLLNSSATDEIRKAHQNLAQNLSWEKNGNHPLVQLLHKKYLKKQIRDKVESPKLATPGRHLRPPRFRVITEQGDDMTEPPVDPIVNANNDRATEDSTSSSDKASSETASESSLTSQNGTLESKHEHNKETAYDDDDDDFAEWQTRKMLEKSQYTPKSFSLLHTVYVTGFDEQTTEKELSDLLTNYGDIAFLQIMPEKNKAHHWYAYVTFMETEVAEKVVGFQITHRGHTLIIETKKDTRHKGIKPRTKRVKSRSTSGANHKKLVLDEDEPCFRYPERNSVFISIYSDICITRDTLRQCLTKYGELIGITLKDFGTHRIAIATFTNATDASRVAEAKVRL
ncbi:DnaJ -like protein [Halotydeus destructor]|nr:DnaJ -like protein [Halotydeus destructor]